MRGNVTVFERNCRIQIEWTGSIKSACIDLFHTTCRAALHEATATIHTHRISAIDLCLDGPAHQLVRKIESLRVVKRLQYHARLGSFWILGRPHMQTFFRLVKRKNERNDHIRAETRVYRVGANQAASTEVAGS